MNAVDVGAQIEPQHAKELLREYRQTKELTNMDAEIMAIYRAIARGRKVIDLGESIRTAGWDNLGRPKLAVARADWTHAYCTRNPGPNGWHCCFTREQWRPRTAIKIFTPSNPDFRTCRALVPLIPAPLRPAPNHLKKYTVLWEADWEAAPVDPMLLRHLSGAFYIVVAAWDLTDVERAVLANHRRHAN
jgi:hypothetical protein